MNPSFLDNKQAILFKRFLNRLDLEQLRNLARDLDLLPEEFIGCINSESVLRERMYRRTADPISWQEHYHAIGRKY